MSHSRSLPEINDAAAADVVLPEFLASPGTCGTELEQEHWVGTVGVRIDEQTAVGVRFNHAGLMDAVVAALGDRVLGLEPTDPDREAEGPHPGEIPTYFSVKINAPTRRRRTPLHYIYRGGTAVVGTREVGRVLGGLEALLSQLLPRAVDRYALDACAVQTPAGVIVAPAAMATASRAVDRVLLPRGFATADGSGVCLDPSTGRVEIPAPVIRLPVDLEALSDLPSAPRGRRVDPGSYPVALWLLATPAEDAGPLRPAKALAFGAGALLHLFPRGAQAALEDLTALLQTVPSSGIAWTSDEDLVGAILRAGESSS